MSTFDLIKIRQMTVCKSMIILSVVACGQAKKYNFRETTEVVETTKSENVTEAPVEEPSILEKAAAKEEKKLATLEINRAIDAGANAIQSKSFQVLKSSIASCFSSTTITLVRADMLVDLTASPLESGRTRFMLPQAGLAPGVDILEFEKANLGGDDTVARTTISSDAISATYLRSLANVADVIAHSCEVDDPFCGCSNEGDARAMLTRCLPQINPDLPEFLDTAKAMVTECNSGPVGQRRVIAALVSSYPFAQGR
jgi:hypothetical protein